MSDLEFEDRPTTAYRQSAQSGRPGLAGWMMQRGFAKNMQQANQVILIAAVVIFIIAGIIFAVSGRESGDTGPVLDPADPNYPEPGGN